LALPRARVLQHGSGESRGEVSRASWQLVGTALGAWVRSSLVPGGARSYGGKNSVRVARGLTPRCMCGDRGRALCWGVHMPRMHERMTRARATRVHICAGVVPTAAPALDSWLAVKVRCACRARGSHRQLCVGVQVHGATVGRTGGGAAVGRADGRGASAALVRGAQTRVHAAADASDRAVGCGDWRVRL